MAHKTVPLVSWLIILTVVGSACAPQIVEVEKQVPIEVIQEVEKIVEVEVTAAPAEPELLVVAVPGDPATLDPASVVSHSSFNVLVHVYSGLLRFSQTSEDEGIIQQVRSEVAPYLAESFDISDDGLIYTFVLREGLEFPSGNPLTTSDVMFSFERYLNAGGIVGWLLGFASITDISQFEVVDDRTVIVTLPERTPLAKLILAFPNVVIVDEDLVKEHSTDDDPWAKEWLGSNIAGIGPYVLEEYVVGRELRFMPNPVSPEPAKIGMLWKIIPSPESQAILLAKGDVDLATGLPERLVNAFSDQEGIRVVSVPSHGIDKVNLNLGMAPFDDVKVRQALAYAVPYDRILDEVFIGMAQPTHSLLAKGIPTYDDSCWDYNYDPETSKALLAEAGYPDGFSTEIYFDGSKARFEHTAELVQEAFAEVGVDVQLRKVTSSVLGERMKKTRDLPMSINYGISWLADPGYALRLRFHGSGPGNFSGYANPDIDMLIDKGMHSPEPERTEIFQEIQCTLINDVPQLRYVQPDWTVVMRDSVKGYLNTGFGIDDFSFIYAK